MSLRRGFFVQLQVVHALILRETRTRFGTHQLGYLWAIAEPVLWVLTFYTMMSLAERSPPTGMTMSAFIVTGLVPYQLFRETSSRILVAISSNRGLLFYPQVRPLDLISARFLLEVATGLSIFALLQGADAIYQGSLQIDDLLRVLAGIGLCGVIGGALGMVLSGLSLYMPSVQNLSGVILRPMFWLSGVFYTANDVPQGLLDIIRFNPVLHCVELVRDGWFPGYATRVGNFWFPCATALVLVLLGLAFERATRNRIELT